MGFSIGGYDLGKAWDESVGALRPQSGNYWKGKGVGKGTLGHWVDQIYGGTTKEVIDTMKMIYPFMGKPKKKFGLNPGDA